MIILKLKGGLGNQMFQYVLGRNLSYIRHTQLKLDIKYYEGNKFRSYVLNHFNIKAEIASGEEIEKLKYSRLWSF